MTLKALATNVEIQGNVRISIWDDMGEEEVEVHELRYVDGLRARLNDPELHHLRNLKVTFMFTPEDGYLHIELERKNNERS